MLGHHGEDRFLVRKLQVQNVGELVRRLDLALGEELLALVVQQAQHLGLAEGEDVVGELAAGQFAQQQRPVQFHHRRKLIDTDVLVVNLLRLFLVVGDLAGLGHDVHR